MRRPQNGGKVMSEIESEFESLGIIIPRTGFAHGDSKMAIDLGLRARDIGKEVAVFLISDGIWNSLEGSGDISARLKELLTKNGKVYLSAEHAKAGGLPKDRVMKGIEFMEDSYGFLVDHVMEEWDKVIIC